MRAIMHLAYYPLARARRAQHAARAMTARSVASLAEKFEQYSRRPSSRPRYSLRPPSRQWRPNTEGRPVRQARSLGLPTAFDLGPPPSPFSAGMYTRCKLGMRREAESDRASRNAHA